jgi:hypothetical protein
MPTTAAQWHVCHCSLFPLLSCCRPCIISCLVQILATMFIRYWFQMIPKMMFFRLRTILQRGLSLVFLFSHCSSYIASFM